MAQKVLVFEAKLLDTIGHFEGYSLDVEKCLSAILDKRNNCFIERKTAEHDFAFKQIIPYVVLRYESSLFTYMRGRRGNEKRLSGLRSIGLGGHIEPIDRKAGASTRALYLRAAKRELQEEVKIDTSHADSIVALINDESTDVGRVHFGVLHLWDLAAPKVTSREPEISEGRFMSIDELREMYSQLENWSQIALDIIEKLKIE
jgi:predicted NUDIX family phosphoesterase